MKKRTLYLLTLLAFTGTSLSTTATMAQSVLTKQPIDIFPKPEEGYTQFVIEVPHSANDNQKKIEFFVGKHIETDQCNSHALIGSFEEKNLDGWGYNYFIFKTDGGVRSTMMACPDSEKTINFVESASQIGRYNGKLPIVIYAPEGYEVKFKIWKVEDDTYHASEIKQE